MMTLNRLSERFKMFADQECRGSSVLYEYLSLHIAHDEELLQIAAQARAGQPVPNLLLGAVHYLLLKGCKHELREYYGSIVSNPREYSSAFPYFKDFCIQYSYELISILQSRLVQTNEVRRCAYLYPSFCTIYNITHKPLALIEIGTSAGLQLMWDQYRYSYHSDEVYGNEQSELHMRSIIQGERTPLLLKQSPPVTTRIGLDLHVNDLNNPDDYLWLRALIWPEHQERNANLELASRYIQKGNLELIEGDGVKLLPAIASRIPEENTLCIFHTHVANQIPHDAKLELTQTIQRLGAERDVFHLYNNMWDANLHLDYYMDGIEVQHTIAETEGHGRWFTWKM
ncbi:DUF2332 domain-containing protein [Paenibacillus marinisediminis]